MSTVGNTEKDMPIVSGSLWAAIWYLTWPIMINMCAFAIGTFADTWVVGRLGADAQAAMGIGWQIRYFMMMLTIALQAGTIAMVSRYFGARDIENALEASRQALIFGGIFGIVSAAIGLVTCRSLLHLLGASAEVEQQGWDYLKFSLVANIPSTLLWTSQSIFRSAGNARTAMITTVETVVLIILLDVVLCLQPLHMGIGGIGLSWFIGASIGFARNITKLRGSQLSKCLHIFNSLRNGISKEWFLRFMRIGLPSCMQEMGLIAGSFGLFYILSRTAQPAINQAAWGVGWRMEELLVQSPMFALNMAIGIIVGQNLGARRADRAEKAAWNVVYVGIIINILVAALLWFFASNIATLMSTDSGVVKVIIDYFHFIVWTEPLFVTWLILSGAMQGAGYTRLPMIITILCFLVIRLTAAWYLTVSGYGANGTWIAMALTSVIAGILMTTAFKWGNWKHQTI